MTPKKDEIAQKTIEEAVKEVEEKFNKQLEAQKKIMDDYVEESTKKFQDQRTINLEIMKKLNVLTKSQEDLLKMFHEQTGESKKVIDTLTRIITQELMEMKKDIQGLQEDLENIYESYDQHECDQEHECHSECDHTEED
jgi:hypothetical protein